MTDVSMSNTAPARSLPANPNPFSEELQHQLLSR